MSLKSIICGFLGLAVMVFLASAWSTGQNRAKLQDAVFFPENSIQCTSGGNETVTVNLSQYHAVIQGAEGEKPVFLGEMKIGSEVFLVQPRNCKGKSCSLDVLMGDQGHVNFKDRLGTLRFEITDSGPNTRFESSHNIGKVHKSLKQLNSLICTSVTRSFEEFEQKAHAAMDI